MDRRAIGGEYIMMDLQKQIKNLEILSVVLSLALVGLFAYLYTITPDPVQTMTVADVKRPELVAEKLNVSQTVAKEIVKQIEVVTQKPPATSYTVPAKNTVEAAKVVEKQIKEDKVPV